MLNFQMLIGGPNNHASLCAYSHKWNKQECRRDKQSHWQEMFPDLNASFRARKVQLGTPLGMTVVPLAMTWG